MVLRSIKEHLLSRHTGQLSPDPLLAYRVPVRYDFHFTAITAYISVRD